MTIRQCIHALFVGDNTANRVVPATGFTALLTLVSSGAMAFLAVFAIALAAASGELATRWEAELDGAATIRITAAEAELEAQADAVLAALKQTPGIAAGRRVEASEQLALLQPWFGEGIPLDKLRLPVLIDVTETAEGPDQTGLAQRLAAEAPDAVYDNHSRWRIPLIDAATRLRQLGLTALLLIAGVTGVTIVLAASAALAANGKIIDVLRLVGAKDSWIIRAFVRRFTVRAASGALIGTLVAMLTVALIPGGVETGVLSGLGFDGTEWLWPLAVPLAVAALAFAATTFAARRRLAEGA
ncbi:MAG: cell division protein FtsX [Pseudomonadota bacterium]